MKRIILKPTILFLLLFAAVCVPGKSQNVFNYVYDASNNIVRNPLSSYSDIQVAQFKMSALTYLKNKSLEKSDTVSSLFLDTQAYYLSEYVTLFLSDLIKFKRCAEQVRKERILMFTEASLECPIFDDPDTETTMSCITSNSDITPFSLNTDWEKAYTTVQQKMEEAKETKKKK